MHVAYTQPAVASEHGEREREGQRGRESEREIEGESDGERTRASEREDKTGWVTVADRWSETKREREREGAETARDYYPAGWAAPGKVPCPGNT